MQMPHARKEPAQQHHIVIHCCCNNTVANILSGVRPGTARLLDCSHDLSHKLHAACRTIHAGGLPRALRSCRSSQARLTSAPVATYSNRPSTNTNTQTAPSFLAPLSHVSAAYSLSQRRDVAGFAQAGSGTADGQHTGNTHVSATQAPKRSTRLAPEERVRKNLVNQIKESGHDCYKQTSARTSSYLGRVR